MQGDSSEEMEQEGSEDDAARGSARSRRKGVVESPSAEEKPGEDDEDSSDGEDVQEVS